MSTDNAMSDERDERVDASNSPARTRLDEREETRDNLAEPYIGPGPVVGRDAEAQTRPEVAQPDEPGVEPVAADREPETPTASAGEAGTLLEPAPEAEHEERPDADLIHEPEQPIPAGTTPAMAPMPPRSSEPEPVGVTATAGSGLDDRMQEIQLAFIDDPRKAAQDADALVDDLLQSLTDELARRRSEFGDGRPGADSQDTAPRTERLRVAVQQSRELVDLLSQAREHARR